LVEEDGNDNEEIEAAYPTSDSIRKDSREPEPYIVTIMSRLDLQLVSLQQRNRQGLPHRFIVFTKCSRGLEPSDAVNHASGAPSKGGHDISIPLAQRKALRKWIEQATDLHSAQNMPPLPNQHGPPIPFLQTFEGYKCNWCTVCSSSKNVMGNHTGTTPGHPTARSATLQHFFHNRLLFAVQPNRYNDGQGNEDGVDLYVLYAKQYGLDVEDESTTCIPFFSDEKEMPLLLQITRWFDHLWRYLRNDDVSSEDEDEEVEDEGMEKRENLESDEEVDDDSREKNSDSDGGG
jgi:hypothetical protein